MSRPRRLGPLDLGFLMAETRESMMHVGALMQFAPPDDAHPEFLYDLMNEIKEDTESRVVPPWNLKLRHPDLVTSPLQAWVEDTRFDVEYHVRRSALPVPGGERELGILVSRLHSNSIDFHRPPWEAHFIEGLPNGRFALYFKVHHSLIDGYTGMRLLSRSLSSDPGERDTPLFFVRPDPSCATEGDSAPEDRTSTHPDRAALTLDGIMDRLKEELSSTRAAGRALATVVRASRSPHTTLVAPLEAPRSVINQKISRNRRFATQKFDVARLRAVASAHGGTLNDVVLALCATSVRRLLIAQDALPTKPLTTMMPVNLRPKDDPGGGNAVGAILASLATDVADPHARYDAIVASTRSAKEQLRGLSASAIMQYSGMLLAPMLISQPPGAAGRVRPAFNLVISNVPGPSTPLYFRGYQLDAYYPLSIPFHGYGLNITVVTYVDSLNFGFTGDRDALPHLQRLAVYAADALAELEAPRASPGVGAEPTTAHAQS